MPTYDVTLEDGRVVKVKSDADEAAIKKQANRAEMSRVVIANRLGRPAGPEPSLAVSIVKVKD